MNTISISVVSEEKSGESNTIKGGPSSITSKISEKIIKGVKNIELDKKSLENCIETSISIVKIIKTKTISEKSIYPDSISLQLGVTSGGTVGFLGNNLDLKVATSISLTLKITKEEDGK